jgi:hypothetical protein
MKIFVFVHEHRTMELLKLLYEEGWVGEKVGGGESN